MAGRVSRDDGGGNAAPGRNFGPRAQRGELERALPAARSVAARYPARTVVLHVIELVPSAHEGRRPLEPDDHEHRVHLRELVAQLRADGFDAELETSATSLGDPAAAAARRHRAGMIVLTTRGPRPFVGNLAENVVQRLLHLGRARCWG
jgi:nucleotide-binding universal stress UspA family protein